MFQHVLLIEAVLLIEIGINVIVSATKAPQMVVKLIRCYLFKNPEKVGVSNLLIRGQKSADNQGADNRGMTVLIVIL